MNYDITPVPKPRQTQSDKWKKRPCVMRYRAFADEVRLKKVKFGNGDSLIFGLPMPRSWSAKKKALIEGTPHTQKPDIDNLLKALLDALYGNDSHIWHIGGLKKFWSYEGYLTIEKV
jgi:Holliday junction resolvase RusA-like endonuclease